MTDPWADPSSAGRPYTGPPPTAPPAWGPSGFPPGQGGWYGPPPGYGYGYPGPWGPLPPTGPRRPGQVVAVAVLAFVQAALVLLASVYVFFFASMARTLVVESGSTPSSLVDELATEGSVLALVQVLSVVALVIGGVLALGQPPRAAAFPVLLGALGVQVVLAVYWAVRLSVLSGDLPDANPSAVLAWFALLFVAMPAVALGLVLAGPGRRWLRPGTGVRA